MNTVPRVFAYLRRYPWMALGTLGCAILSTLMVMVYPAVVKRLVDEVLNQHHAERLVPLVLTAALAFLLQNGLSSLRLIINNTFEQRVIFGATCIRISRCCRCAGSIIAPRGI
jgi:ATP-binding cassette subfamily B protein